MTARRKPNKRGQKRTFKGNARRFNKSRASQSRQVEEELTALKVGSQLVTPTSPPEITYEWRLKEIDGKPAQLWNTTVQMGWDVVQEADLVSPADKLKMSALQIGNFYQCDGMVLMQIPTQTKLRYDLGYAEDELLNRRAIQEHIIETYSDEQKGDLIPDLKHYEPGIDGERRQEIVEQNFEKFKQNIGLMGQHGSRRVDNGYDPVHGWSEQDQPS